MREVARGAIVCLSLVLFSQTALASPPEELDRARAAFREGKYPEAQLLLSALLYPKTRLSDPRQLAEAHLLLGLAHLETGDELQADREVEEALLLDSQLSLDPLVFSPRAIAHFSKKQAELADRARGEEEKAQVARERLRLRKLIDNMVVLEKRSYWVNFVPFGAGQFQNGQRKKGLFFLGTEAALGGLSMSLWSYQVIKYGFRGKVPPDEVGSVNRMQTVQAASGLLCLGMIVWGVADSLAHYEHVVSRQPDPALLQEFERLEKEAPPPVSRLYVSPAIGADQAGLMMGFDFSMATLRIKNPASAATVYALYKNLTSVGSGPDNDIVLSDPLVPDTFAHIQCDGTGYSITALTRKVDLTVNGRNRRRHRLAHEDRLAVGPIEMEFLLHEPVEPLAEPGSEPVEAYERLNQFSARLMARGTLPELLEELIDAVIEVSGAQKGFLILAEGQTLDIRVARNVKRDNIGSAALELSDSIIARVLETKQPLIISDAMNDADFQNAMSVLSLKLSSVMCVPLLDQGQLLGILYLGNDSVVRLFSTRTLRLVTVFAAQASLILKNALLLDQLQSKNRHLEGTLEAMRFGDIVGACPAMQAVFRGVDKVASTDVSVLITGETGTGKELIAREIHRRSPRKDGPFVAINCGAIPEALLESELFGHKRGAFTGAVSDQLGRFARAHRGTLFLDEIAEMPANLQVKILRAIQERLITPVGDVTPRAIDIRILAATHRNLEEEIAASRFREDLYYRLNVVQVPLPPLREREADIELLARYFLSRCITEHAAPVRGFSPDGLSAIKRHSWPGNIRELENRIRKAVILCEGPLVGPRDLDLHAGGRPRILTLAEAKEQFQRRYINEILHQNDGNRTQTARELGVDPRTVFRHLEKDHVRTHE